MWSPKTQLLSTLKGYFCRRRCSIGKVCRLSAVQWHKVGMQIVVSFCVYVCGRACEWGQEAWICQSISPIDGNLLFVNWKKHWRRNTQLGCPESKHTNTQWRAEGQRRCQYCRGFFVCYFWQLERKSRGRCDRVRILPPKEKSNTKSFWWYK